ncbi:MAG: hypothetical protein ACM37W_24140 [Actinomycetota bacterium]
MEPAHTDLLQQIASLSATFPNLGGRLSEAAKALQEAGTPPSESLLEELTTYHKNFTHVQKQALELGQSLPTPKEIVSLKDLENWVGTAIASQANAAVRQKALAVLERVLAIAHREQSDFAPLESVRAKARELQQAVTDTPTTELHPDAIALVEGKHPVTAVVKLIEEQDNLDDEQWVTLEETVGAAFGKQLAVAISRGKLIIPSPQPIAKPETKPQPPTIQVIAPQPVGEPIPEVIVIPTGGAAVAKPAVEPEIQILESPPPAAPMHEVIIVPSVEVPLQPLPSDEQPTVVFGKAPVNVNPQPEPAEAQSSIGLKVLVHLQGLGDRTFGPQEYAGTRGQSRRLEAFQIEIDPPILGLNIQYMAHVSGVGDTPWLNGGELAGIRGQAKRIEGFAVRLIGPEAGDYDVFYSAHIERVGDSPVVSNGQYCGTKGKALRVEGMKVWIVRK